MDTGIDYQQLVRKYGSHVKARQALAKLLEQKLAKEVDSQQPAAGSTGNVREQQQTATRGHVSVNSKLNRTQPGGVLRLPLTSLAQSIVDAVRASHGSSRLELPHKNITEFPRPLLSTFALQMGSLRTVKMPGNKLTRVPGAFFRFHPMLTELDLSNNKLRSLPKSMGLLERLADLKLQWNCLETVPASLGNLTNLRLAVLSNNKISELPHSFGEGMKQLRELKLDSNNLTRIPLALSHLTGLEVLSLHRNQIVSLALLQPPLRVLVESDEMANDDRQPQQEKQAAKGQRKQKAGGGEGKTTDQDVQQEQEIWDEMYDPLMDGTVWISRTTRQCRRTRPVLVKKHAHVNAAKAAQSLRAAEQLSSATVQVKTVVKTVGAVARWSALESPGPKHEAAEVEPVEIAEKVRLCTAEQAQQREFEFSRRRQLDQEDARRQKRFATRWDLKMDEFKMDEPSAAMVNSEDDEDEGIGVCYTNCGTGEVVTRMPLCLDQWGGLCKLRQLLLSHQQLHALPSSVGDCISLTHLDCSNNDIRTLPSSIGRLRSLTSLDCGHNSIVRLPVTIGTLGMLATLVATGNRLVRA
jgi:Leucine-rich repeat (LRR) protein